MINAIIIDDDDRCVEVLHSFLTTHCPDVKVLGCAYSLEKAYNIISQKKPNLVFLDVVMPQGSGFDLLQKFSKIDFEVIFVSAFEDYALQAIKFHAIDYLLKPLSTHELIQAVGKVKKALDNKANTLRLQQLVEQLKNPNQFDKQFSIPTNRGRELININEIIRCTSEGSYTWFYLTEGKRFLSTKNLGEYEKLFLGWNDSTFQKFFRVHHSHLINLNFISTINSRQSFVIMNDASKIRIAQRRKSQFLELLKNANLY